MTAADHQHGHAHGLERFQGVSGLVCGATMLRTKNRLLLVYIYSEYKDEATVHWVMKTSEAWADTILKSN